ncbi:glycosyltransferase [Allochromatium palmeri]|uniref:Glycosyltransferase n=2 Tax=Allochromatium palmeri TaxID=231048 RepID=A0A6N8EDV3_9GAMM|nr:glycosyltransferase [Allochromatium palmeri]
MHFPDDSLSRLDGRWLLLLVLGGLAIWRLAIAALMPVTQDEAYYFDWARALAWGYFDHPPGVALLGLGVRLEPGSVFMARLGGLLAGLATLVVLERFYRHCGLTDIRDRTLALMLAGATLAGIASGVITTPDSVLALTWALALHEAERALAVDPRRWITAGIAIGLGLLGKYTMFLIGPVLLLAILGANWRSLLTRWPYLGAGVALLVFAPNLIWNAQNDWLTLGFQFGHGFATEIGGAVAPEAATIEQSGPETSGERAASLLEYVGVQIALWGLIALPILLAPWLGRRETGAATPCSMSDSRLTLPGRTLLLAASLFPLGFFALVALISDVEANWPAMYLLGAAPLAALWLRRVRRWAWMAALANLALATFYVIHAVTVALPLPDSHNRILRETHGFAELAEIAAGLDAPVYADRYQLTAMLRFYRPDLAATSQWPGLSRPSEYLRGRIAPRIDLQTVTTPFWLLTRFGAPPQIPGFSLTTERRLFDCPGQPLSEGRESPCRRPLHRWSLYRYKRDGAR